MYHQPVLLSEIISVIPQYSKTIVDGTFGHGGHSVAIAEEFPQAQIIGIDRDALMIQKAQERLGPETTIQILQGSYADIGEFVHTQQIGPVDFILLDIGVNMDHFKENVRGFSIHEDAVLDMRFDTTQAITAQTIINTYDSKELSALFQKYADFTVDKSDEIAFAINKQKSHKKIETTGALKEILGSCGLGKNAIAVIFQALRIEVNQELTQLEQFLDVFDTVLVSGGRCAIISYHSIEDRIVKQSFKSLVASEKYIAIHKKAIKPSRQEIQKNRAARSAVLRIIEKK